MTERPYALGDMCGHHTSCSWPLEDEAGELLTRGKRKAAWVRVRAALEIFGEKP